MVLVLHVHDERLAFRHGGGRELEGQNGDLRGEHGDQYNHTRETCTTRALGPEAAPDAPGTIPRLAFHRAKLSSSASSLAYSSTDFAAPGLYPALPVLSQWSSHVAQSHRLAWGGGGGEIILFVLQRDVFMFNKILRQSNAGRLTGADMMWWGLRYKRVAETGPADGRGCIRRYQTIDRFPTRATALCRDYALYRALSDGWLAERGVCGSSQRRHRFGPLRRCVREDGPLTAV